MQCERKKKTILVFWPEHVEGQGCCDLRWRRLGKGNSEVHLETYKGEIQSS